MTPERRTIHFQVWLALMKGVIPLSSLHSAHLSDAALARLAHMLGQPDPVLGGWTVEQLCSVAFPFSEKPDVEAAMALILATLHTALPQDAFLGLLVTWFPLLMVLWLCSPLP